MATGLLALLDDIAGIAKVAAASVDDIIGQAAKAGIKAAGVVIDDAAVAPSYVVGFASNRELPIVWKIARGSVRNKLLFLLPAALILSLIAPWAITPLLMLGGAYLCYEGAEKVYEAFFPHEAHHHEEAIGAAPRTPQALEDAKVRGAIQTDFILSAEIMAITLASLEESSFIMQAIVLALVAVAITAAVYLAVAFIVRADDIGVSLAREDRSGLSRGLGRGIVKGMPFFLKALSILGTAAMIWVGGSIILHGLEEFGAAGPAHLVHDIAVAAHDALPSIGGIVEWLVTTVLSGIVGLVIGGILIPIVQYVLTPAVRSVIGLFRRNQPASPH